MVRARKAGKPVGREVCGKCGVGKGKGAPCYVSAITVAVSYILRRGHGAGTNLYFLAKRGFIRENKGVIFGRETELWETAPTELDRSRDNHHIARATPQNSYLYPWAPECMYAQAIQLNFTPIKHPLTSPRGRCIQPSGALRVHACTYTRVHTRRLYQL